MSTSDPCGIYVHIKLSLNFIGVKYNKKSKPSPLVSKGMSIWAFPDK